MAHIYFLSVVISSLLGVLTLATPLNTPATCQNPTVRKEWRSLTVGERKDYIRAVKCLLSSPPKTQGLVSAVQNRYEDFVAMHINTTLGGLNMNNFRGPVTLLSMFLSDPSSVASVMRTHDPIQILPWHRYAIQAYEDALRDECGWKGGQPYWDYHLDSTEAGGNFLKSPIFDPVTGFGGNGANSKRIPFGSDIMASIIPGFRVPTTTRGGGGCLRDGPFKDVLVHLGPFGQVAGATPRCLTRSLNSMPVNRGAVKRNYARVLKSKTFLEFGRWIESPDVHFHANDSGVSFEPDFHTMGHGSIGGELNDPLNSVNDPIFWMHHTGMDRLWALWQEQDAKRWSDAPDVKMWMGPTVQNRTIAEVYDTQNRDGKGYLCYRYDGLDAKYYMS